MASCWPRYTAARRNRRCPLDVDVVAFGSRFCAIEGRRD
jgi:hypothetical protein